MTITKVSNLPPLKGCRRAGVLVYSKIPETYIIMGRDARCHDLTDFGGGVEHGEKPVMAAIRELQEESLKIFVKPDISDIQDCISVSSPDILIILIRIDMDFPTVKTKFVKKLAKYSNPEICDIIDIKVDEFCKLILTDEIYTPVKLLLSQIDDLSEFFESLP